MNILFMYDVEMSRCASVLDLHSSWVKLLALAAHLVLNMVAASVFCVQSVCLMMGVAAASVTLSSAPRALFDARPVRQDESTSKMSHKVFSIVWRSFQRAAGLCVELFPSVLLLNSMMMVLMQTQRRVSCRTFSREVKTNN